MKFTPLLLTSLVAIFALTLPLSSAQAGRRGGGGGGSNAKKEPPKPQYEAIDSVDKTAGTITVSYRNSPSPNAKTLKITDRTEIQVNGAKATINDLQPGMKISVGMGMDPTTASSLSASPAPPDPKPAK